jgi:F-type H+-transporting ATPase subunit b
MIELNWSLAVASVIFILTWAALSRLLLKPLLEVLSERQARTSGTFENAEAHEAEFEALVQTYDRKIKEEKQVGFKLAEKLRQEALSERQKRIQSARDEADSMLKKAREEIQSELEAARKELRRESEDIARAISDRVLRASG